MNRDSGVVLSAIEKERGLGPPVILCVGFFRGEEKRFARVGVNDEQASGSAWQ